MIVITTAICVSDSSLRYNHSQKSSYYSFLMGEANVTFLQNRRLRKLTFLINYKYQVGLSL
jgi:hypothetical protein